MDYQTILTLKDRKDNCKCFICGEFFPACGNEKALPENRYTLLEHPNFEGTVAVHLRHIKIG